ncbi:MAG: DUF1456 family protein [Motiliproteus sp.]
MINNDILRRLRYNFDLNDSQMIAIFAEADFEVTRAQVSDWLKKEDDAAYQTISDPVLATFLNGFINQKRGKRDGEQPEPEQRLNNNIVFRKLKIALDLKAEEIIELMELGSQRLSKHELSAFFRKTDHKHYRECKDQVLRGFLKGLQQQHRGTLPVEKAPERVASDTAWPADKPRPAAKARPAAKTRPTAKRPAAGNAKPGGKWPGANKPKLLVVKDGKLRQTLSMKDKPSEGKSDDS